MKKKADLNQKLFRSSDRLNFFNATKLIKFNAVNAERNDFPFALLLHIGVMT